MELTLLVVTKTRGTKVNGSHHGDSPLLRPTGIQIATKSLPGPANREHRKLIGVKTMSLGMNYSFYYYTVYGMLPVFQNLSEVLIQATEKTV